MRSTLAVGAALVILTGACASPAAPTASSGGTGSSPAPAATSAAGESPAAATPTSTAAAKKPGIPDNGTQIVILHSYDEKAAMAQMEPAKLSGDTFTGTGDVIPVGIDPGAKWFSVQGGDPECLKGNDKQPKNPGPGDVIASCLHGFDKKMIGEPVQIATHNNGAVYEVAEVYLP